MRTSTNLLSIVALFIVFIWYIRNDGWPRVNPRSACWPMRRPTPRRIEQLTNGAIQLEMTVQSSRLQTHDLRILVHL
jgi:hypothetical protein